MEQSSTLSVGAVNMVLMIAQAYGANASQLAEAVGLSAANLANPDGRATIEQVQKLWELAIEATGDECLALRLGQNINLAAAGLVAYLMMNAPTLGASIEKLCAYQAIICEGIRTECHVQGDTARLELHILSAAIKHPRNAVDSELSIYHTAIRQLTGLGIEAREVHFSYPAPAYIAEHQKVFGSARLVFNARVSALVLDAHLLDLPVVNASHSMALMFEQYAREQLSHLQHDSLSNKVKGVILQYLKGNEPGIEHVARSLGIGVRNLQLKLKEEHTSYQQLLDQVRKDIALMHLQDNKLSTTDIAYLLGFSEPSVFFRSFKKWTGHTPGAYRARQAA